MPLSTKILSLSIENYDKFLIEEKINVLSQFKPLIHQKQANFLQLEKNLNEAHYKQDQYVYKAGDPGKRLYFIKEGQVEITMMADLNADAESNASQSNPLHKIKIITLGNGQYFGEKEILNKTSRVQNAQCLKKTVLYPIKWRKFLQVIRFFQETVQLIKKDKQLRDQFELERLTEARILFQKQRIQAKRLHKEQQKQIQAFQTRLKKEQESQIKVKKKKKIPLKIRKKSQFQQHMNNNSVSQKTKIKSHDIEHESLKFKARKKIWKQMNFDIDKNNPESWPFKQLMALEETNFKSREVYCKYLRLYNKQRLSQNNTQIPSELEKIALDYLKPYSLQKHMNFSQIQDQKLLNLLESGKMYLIKQYCKKMSQTPLMNMQIQRDIKNKFNPKYIQQSSQQKQYHLPSQIKQSETENIQTSNNSSFLNLSKSTMENLGVPRTLYLINKNKQGLHLQQFQQKIYKPSEAHTARSLSSLAKYKSLSVQKQYINSTKKKKFYFSVRKDKKNIGRIKEFEKRSKSVPKINTSLQNMNRFQHRPQPRQPRFTKQRSFTPQTKHLKPLILKYSKHQQKFTNQRSLLMNRHSPQSTRMNKILQEEQKLSQRQNKKYTLYQTSKKRLLLKRQKQSKKPSSQQREKFNLNPIFSIQQ